MAIFTISLSTLNTMGDKNVTLYINDITAQENDAVNNGDVLKITCDSGYIFTSAPKMAYGAGDPNSVTFDLDSNTVATHTVSGFGSNFWTIKTEILLPNFTISQDILDDVSSANCAIYINDIAVQVNDAVYTNDVIKLETDSGYVFTQPPSVYTAFGEPNPTDFNLTSDTVAELTITGAITQFFDISILTSQESKVSGSNAIYKIDSSILKDVNANRFETLIIGSESTIIDHGVNILSAIKLFFDVPAKYILSEQDIILGTYNTNVSAPLVDADVIPLDLGTINIPTPDTALEQQNATIKLYLPFANPITLEPKYVMGESISIEYLVSVYTGTATINIYSSALDEVLTTATVTIGFNIPYSSTNGLTPLVENSNIDIGGQNNIESPFIEISNPLPDNLNSKFIVPVTDSGVIGSRKGYIEVENIELTVNASNSEKQTIIGLLSQGVIIK